MVEVNVVAGRQKRWPRMHVVFWSWFARKKKKGGKKKPTAITREETDLWTICDRIRNPQLEQIWLDDQLGSGLVFFYDVALFPGELSAWRIKHAANHG